MTVARQRILLEFAINFAAKHDGYSVWLLDRRRRSVKLGPIPTALRTRHLAEKWEKDGTLKRLKRDVWI